MVTPQEALYDYYLTEYENRRDEFREEQEQAIRAVMEALKAVMRYNRDYLTYREVKFKDQWGDKERIATHNALTSIVGRAIGWETLQGREIAFKVLEEVNDHKKAAEVAEVLGLKSQVTCGICEESYEFEDDGTVDCMPDGYLTGGLWICDRCGSCPECGKTLEKEPEKRGKTAQPCKDCESKTPASF